MEKIKESKKWNHPKYKILRGVYLTGVGQERESYYFKISVDHEDFEKVGKGTVCITFYQGEQFVTALPSLIRVDAVLNAYYPVQVALKQEKELGYPVMPIVSIYEEFDEIEFQKIITTGKKYQSEIKQISLEKQKEP